MIRNSFLRAAVAFVLLSSVGCGGGSTEGGGPKGPSSGPPPKAGEQIVKVKQFSVKPMNPEEAVLQLELIGHDFFVFRSDDSGEINVIYRRKDGGYGLIEPQG